VAAEVICCSSACVHGILAGQHPAHLALHVDSLSPAVEHPGIVSQRQGSSNSRD